MSAPRGKYPVYLTTSDAAKLLGVTAQRVIQLANAGRLPVAAKTASGWRLFDRSQVAKLARERDGAK